MRTTYKKRRTKVKKNRTVVLVSGVPIYCLFCGEPMKMDAKSKSKSAIFLLHYPSECKNCRTWYQFVNRTQIEYMATVDRFLNKIEG